MTLIFNGSPRAGGDTSSLVGLLTERLKGEVKIVNAYRSGISPCVDCRYCRINSGCAIDDGMQEVYRYIGDSDNIVIASPIYFSELTGRLLDVGSRFQTYYCAAHFRQEKSLLKSKKGGVILVGGGDGNSDKPIDTAVTLLHHLCCTDIFAPVVSHRTESIPALCDKQAVSGIYALAEYFNKEV